MSEFFTDVCWIMSLQYNFIIFYHPQASGQLERYSHTILTALQTYVADPPRD